MIIDAHVLLGPRYTGINYSADEYIDLMEQHKIDCALACPHKPLSGNFEEANESLAVSIADHSEKLFGIVRVNPWQKKKAVIMAETWLDQGFRGIHLFPWEETFQVNDCIVNPLVELASARNVPVVIEAGYPVLSHIAKIANLAQSNPTVKFYLTNAGQIDLSGDTLADVSYFMRLLPNLHLGTSSAVAFLWLAELISDTNTETRIHFESNYPFTDVYLELFRIQANPIDELHKNAVLSGNSKKLFQL